jgi:hypothetical protein
MIPHSSLYRQHQKVPQLLAFRNRIRKTFLHKRSKLFVVLFFMTKLGLGWSVERHEMFVDGEFLFLLKYDHGENGLLVVD